MGWVRLAAWGKRNQFWVRGPRGPWLARGRVGQVCMGKKESILGAGPEGPLAGMGAGWVRCAWVKRNQFWVRAPRAPWLARGRVGQACIGKKESILGAGP